MKDDEITMATIKSYTDLEQTKKLAEILPLESADMFLALNGIIPVMSKYIDEGLVTADETAIPCWSLASLIGVLPEKYTELIKEGGMYRIIIKDSYMTSLFYNPVDACYEMILKLHELNLL